MQFYRSDQVPERDLPVVFKESGWPAAIWGAFMLSWTLGACWLAFPAAFQNGRLLGLVTVLLGIPILFIMGGGGLLFLQAALQSRRPSNWLLRHGPEGLLLNLRSYQNAHLPEPHETVAFIPSGEVALVRGRVSKHHRPGDRGVTSMRKSSLELVLLSADTGQLETLLEKERKLPGAGRGFVKSRSNHAPVSVPRPSVIRLAWGGSAGAVRPRLEEALAILSGGHGVLATEQSEVDYRQLHGEELDDHLLELVEAGDLVSAVTIARRYYGMGTTEAKQFVEGLRDSPSGRGGAR